MLYGGGVNLKDPARTILTLLVALLTTATAWAQKEVTYTISDRAENAAYTFTLNGSDGTSAEIYKTGSSYPKSITAQMGDDVTFSVTSATGTANITVNGVVSPTTINTIGFSDYFKSIDGVYVFTFTSKKQKIVRIQIDGFVKEERITIIGGQSNIEYTYVQTTATTYCNSNTVTVNWDCVNYGAPGKFIVTYADSPQSHINYVLNGGTLTDGNTAIFASSDGLANLPTPEKLGYTFAGWYYNADFSGDKIDQIYSANPQDYTLYAKWTPTQYNITFVKNNGESNSVAHYTIESDIVFYEPGYGYRMYTPHYTGYDFMGWYENEDFSGYEVTQIKKGSTGDRTFYAKWEIMDENGDGRSVNPFKIKNEDDLLAFAERVNGGDKCEGIYFRQTADIVVTQSKWTPIGSTSNPFRGNYDGYNHTISGIKIKETTARQQGLFGVLSNGTIKNVILVNSSIQAYNEIGGIVGKSLSGVIKNCHVRESVKIILNANQARNFYSGGIVGYNYGGLISQCTSLASITRKQNKGIIGGIVGYTTKYANQQDELMNHTIVNCFSYNIAPYGKKDDDVKMKNVAQAYKIDTDGTISLPDKVSLTDGFHYNGVHYYKENANVNLSLTPQDGYEIVSVSDKNGTIITPDKNGKYCFTTTNMDNTLTATLKKLPVTTQYGALYITEYEDSKTAMLDGDYTGTESVSIPDATTVDEVILNRSFEGGKYSTIVLPFDAAIPEGVGEFYTFGGVEYKESESKWIATVYEQSTIFANTPYIFKPNDDINQLAWNVSKITLQTATAESTVKDPKYGDWTFKGTYAPEYWATPADHTYPIYGFAGVNEHGVTIGEFVRAHSNVSIKPLRCYLEYHGSDATFNATISKTAPALPDRIEIRVINPTAAIIEPDDPTLNPDGGDISTPVSETIAPTADAKVWSYDRAIIISAQPNTAYRIIDASGRLLKEGFTNTDRDELRLGGNGIVIVIINQKSYKIQY